MGFAINRVGVIFGALSAVLGALALATAAQSPALADAPSAAPQMVDDFRLPDQNYLGRQLYRLGDAKAW